METQRHALWYCTVFHQMRGIILRIFATTLLGCILTWGAVVWSLVEGDQTAYQSPPDSMAYCFSSMQATRTISSYKNFQSPHMLDRRWDLVSTTTMWFIWKRCCQYLYEGACEPPAKTIMAIWLEITHNLYGQLQELQGNFENIVK